MNESALRWKARIGGLKGLSLLILTGIAALWFSMGERILQSIQGQSEPAQLTIGDLLAGQTESTSYVAVSGIAYYGTGYEETSDGRVVTSYYLLIDEQTGESVVVRAESTDVAEREPAPADVTGVLHQSPAELEEIVAADVSWLSKQGIALDPSMYLAAGERPMPALLGMGLLTASLALVLLCLAPFFLPGTVFYPKPIELTAGSAPVRPADAGLRATGRFQQLKRMDPRLEVGKRWQRFTLCPANLLSLPDGDLLIYIHYVLRTKLYGVVTVSKHESDWGVIIRRGDAWQIEPGILLGWKDRRALRFQRQDLSRKPETLYLTVDDGQAQSELVQRVRGGGFPVGMGIAP